MACPPYVNSAYGQVLAVTSLSRPTGYDAYEGRFIYETDTDRIYAYDGTTWIFKDWNSAAARPGVSLSDAAQSIPTNSSTAITWGTEVSDPDGWTAGGIALVTVPAGWDGVYTVNASASWATTGLGTTPATALLINGATVYSNNGLAPYGIHTLSVARAFVAGDTIQFVVFQTSGAAVNVNSTMLIAWLGR